MRKKVIIFLAGAVVCLLMGWYWFNKPRQGVQFKSTEIAITAEQLYNAYNDNEAAADKLYLDKIIEVKGKVSDTATVENDAILSLDAQPSGGAVSCRFSPGKDVSVIQKGTEITVKGKCTGFNLDVNLADCIIITK